MDMQITLDRCVAEAFKTLGRTLGVDEIEKEDAFTLWRFLIYDRSQSWGSVNSLLALDSDTLLEFDRYHKKLLEISRLRSLPYDDYLNTEHWQSVRQKALERDGHRCRVCNSTEQLNVHHRSYERRGFEEPEDVTTLCKECHQTFHENGQLAINREA